jgi:RimJ/RimL family protein N-acetyltransferase
MRSGLAFIILERTSDRELATTDIPTLPMVGDVNIFLNGTPSDQDFESKAEIMIASELAPSEYLRSIPITQPFFRCSPHQSSLELSFFPEQAHRRKGLATRALQLMFSYTTESDSPSPLPVLNESLVARIGDQNTASIALFQQLGFEITKHVDVFEETEMRYTSKGAPSVWLGGERCHFAG